MKKTYIISIILFALLIIACIVCGCLINPTCFYIAIAPTVGILFNVYMIFHSKKKNPETKEA